MHDLLVVGGAAGASWEGPAGWSAFVIVPRTNERKMLVGAQADTRLERADLLGIAAAIQWYHDRYVVAEQAPAPRVLCCTDSRQAVQAGTRQAPRSVEEWLYIEWFEHRGYRIDWLWASRDQHPQVYQEAERARHLFASAFAAPESAPV